MSWAGEHAAVETRFEAEFGAVRPDVPIIYDNVPEDPDPPFVWLSVIPLDSVQVTIGKPARWRHNGIVQVSAYVPAAAGTRAARALLDDAAAIFRGKILDGMHFGAPSILAGGTVQDGAYRLNLRIPFFRDEVF